MPTHTILTSASGQEKLALEPRKKIVVMLAVSLGIVASAFLIPLVVIPAVLTISSSSECAISTGCAQDTFSKCGAYQSSGDSTSLTDSMSKGMKGMLCMMGLDAGAAQLVVGMEHIPDAATLNNIQPL